MHDRGTPLLEADIDDLPYTRMFDGRLVYHHVLLVEPELRAECAARWPGTAPDRFTPSGGLRLDPAGVHGDLEPARLSVGSAHLAVTAADDGFSRRPAPAEVVEGVADLVSVLSEIGLSYLVELGVGMVVSAPAPWPAELRPLFHAAVPHDGDVVALLRALVRAAAEDLARQWVAADLHAAGRPLGNLRDPRYTPLVAFYGELMAVELERRLGAESPYAVPARRSPVDDVGGDDLLAWLDTFPGVPLAKELVCFWYPHWWRTGFITDSPFDRISDLPLPGVSEGDRVVDALELDRRGLTVHGALAGPVSRPRPAPSGRGVDADLAAGIATRFADGGDLTALLGAGPLAELDEAAVEALPVFPFARPDFNHRVVGQHLDQGTDQSSRRLPLITVQAEWILDRLAPRRPRRVLQPMCGPGLWAGALGRLGIRDYVGTDVGPETIRTAASMPNLPPSTVFERVDVREAGRDPAIGEVDLVLNTYEGLNLFPVAVGRELLAHWARHVAPGGHLVLEIRLRGSGTSPYACRARRAERHPGGSALEAADHYLLDEAAALGGGSVVGHRLVTVPTAAPDAMNVYYTLLHLYDESDVRGVLEPAGFTVSFHPNPVRENVGTPESLEARFVVAHRTPGQERPQ